MTLFLVLLLSYFAAHFLRGIWYLIVRLWSEHPANQENDFLKRYDFIRLKDPAAGARIAKLKAERHMASVLIVGLAVAFLLDMTLRVAKEGTLSWLWPVSLVMAAISIILAYRHFTKRYRQAVESHAFLLKYAEWKRQCESGEP
jgi:hypothetical protein